MTNQPNVEPSEYIGLYIHQHWPYRYPYAARTWSVDDYEGFLRDLRALGYNLVMIWPMLETMPSPLTPSDRATLDKIATVIDMAHRKLGMRVWIGLCPNVAAVDEIAVRMPFEERHFFGCDRRVDPGDPKALEDMIRWRETLLRPLAAADAIVTIDSDPGGWAGSVNAEYVNLLVEHRRMYDRIRPGIELYCWSVHGWPTYCRFYQEAFLDFSKPERLDEFAEAYSLLRDADPEPWGLACPQPYADKLERAGAPDLSSRVIAFNYGAIEYEPSFPLTNWWFDAAYQAGANKAPRGCMGNAQTHCVQLPNICAFAMGATGKPKDEGLIVDFAEGLIPGHGELVAGVWRAMGGDDPVPMAALRERLADAVGRRPGAGKYPGLLFRDPQRFLKDLVMMLDLRTEWARFRQANAEGGDPWPPFEAFVRAADQWQVRHEYKDMWWWSDRDENLRKLGSPAIDAAIENTAFWNAPWPWQDQAPTAYDAVQGRLLHEETGTLRLLTAMKRAILTKNGTF